MKIKLAIVTILSIVGIIICSSNYHSNDVMALEYSSSAGVSFTISPSISVSVSGDLIIDELAPGSSSDSNIIDVTVLSNNNTGYTLSSTIGSSTNNYTDLKLDGNSSDDTNKFTNLSTNKASLSNFDDNSWGYSYSTDSGTNWISGNTGSTANGYNGLPIYSSTGIKLVDTTAIGTNTIKFKIGAKASNTQAAGEYTNTVNFAAVGKAVPVSFYDAFKEAASQPGSNITMLNGYYKMQDMSTTICNNVYTSQLTDNSDTMEAQLIDIRDNNVYWVAKLKDGKCWMTQNLDHNIIAEENFYTYDNTDIGHGDIIDTSAKWNPTTNAATHIIDNTNWFNTITKPQSYNPGDNLCWDGIIDNNNSAGVDFGSHLIPCTDNLHYKLGTYYNWTAAIAMNDSSIYNANLQDVNQSICPANWMLPKSGTTHTEPGSTGYLFIQQKITYNNFHLSPIYFIYSGFVADGLVYDFAYRGRWWSSVIYNNDRIYTPHSDAYDVSNFGANSSGARYGGNSVRCVSR